MTAIVLLMTLVLSLLAVPLAAEAQRVAKIPRVGFLRHGRQADAPLQRRLDDFRQGLRELGSMEGQHLLLSSNERSGTRRGYRQGAGVIGACKRINDKDLR